MIYTCYYGKLKKITGDVVFLNISLLPPKWVKIEKFEKLYPTPEIFKNYKYKSGTKEIFEEKYKKEVLGILNVNEVYQELMQIGNGKDVILVCWEVDGDFCHRHIGSRWFRGAGYDVKEWKEQVKEINIDSMGNIL